jgi:hypothetical protein
MFFLSGLLLTVQTVAASNYYVGFNLGGASQDPKISVIDNSLDPDIPNVSYTKNYVVPDATASAYSLFFGYRLGTDVAMEVGFVQTAEVDSDMHGIDDGDDTTDLVATEASQFTYNYLALVGVWPVGTNWTFSGKLGVASWQYDFRQEVFDVDSSSTATPLTIPTSGPVSLPPGVGLLPESTDSYSDTGSDFFYSLGMGYGVNRHFDVKAELVFHAFDPEFINVNTEQQVILFFLGGTYHF